jgi:hypothetical protein
MTNQRKSFIVSVFVILALAFGIMLISQGLMARIDPKPERVMVDDNGVPISAPLPGDSTAKKEAVKVSRTPDVIVPEGEELGRGAADKAAASTENGGETYATATAIPAVPYCDLGTTVGAIHDYDASCGTAGAGDVVYSITPANSGVLSVTTCTAGSPAGVDTKIWVVESVSLTELACNDDDPNCAEYASTLATNVTAGLTYYIVVGAYTAASVSDFEICVDVIQPGHDFTVPMEITFPAADSLIGHVYSVDLTGLPQGNASVTGSVLARSFYYNFTAPVNGMYTFTWCDDGTVPLTPYPPTYPNGRWTAITWPAGPGVGAYAISPLLPSGVIPSPSTCAINGPFTLTFVKVAYTSQMLEICTRQGEQFKGTLTVTWSPLPLTNDDCEDAIDLGVGPTGDVFGHNLGATRDGPGIDMCSPANPSEVCADVWYTWEADQTGYARFDMCAGETDNKLWVYQGTECLSTNPREAMQGGCSDDGCGVGGGPSFGEIYCQAGDKFLIRIAGWYIEGDGTYGDCNAQGMGVFYINCEVFPTSIRPYNDACVNLVPTVLQNRVLLQFPNQTNWWSGWDCLPTQNNVIYEENVWYAVNLPFCADTLEVNFCGSLDGPRYNYNPPYAFAPIFTGCPCSGAYVTINANLRGYQTARCQAYGFDANHDLQRVWMYRQMIPGDYYFAVCMPFYGNNPERMFDFQINFMATQASCVYCSATSNINSCPPVAGATWIDRVSLSNLVNPAAPTVSGCNAYQNFTGLTPAKVYRGFPYTLAVRYGRTGGGALVAGDSCDVWIDWNQNSGFGANQSELGERTRLTRVGPDVVCTINVPLDAYGTGEGPSGQTYMRVRMANAADGNNAACGTKTWGEVEDYLLNVVDLECGDFNIDGAVDATDIAFLRTYYFGLGGVLDFWQRADIDGDGAITIADIIALSDAAYRGGSLNCM